MTAITKTHSSLYVTNCSGSIFVNHKATTAGGFVISSTLQDYKLVVDSVKSPNFWVKKPVRVSYRPRKGVLSAVPPRIPNLKLPKLPVPRKPRPNQGKRSLKRAKQRFNDLYTKVVAIRKKRIDKYNKLMDLYPSRLAKYEAIRNKISSGVVIKKRVKGPLVRELPFNPYSRVETVDTPWVLQSYNSNQKDLERKAGSPDIIRYTSRQFSGWGYMLAEPSPFYLDLGRLSAYQSALSSAESRATAKVFAQLNEQSVHIANVVAERHQSISMIADAAKRLARIILATNLKSVAKGLIPTKGTKVDKQVADDTLAFMFGVRPLIDDIYGSAKVLASLTSPLKDTVKVKAIGNGKSTGFSTSVVVNNDSYGVPFNINYTVETTVTVKVSYVLEYKISNRTASTLQTLGLINPVEVAWEMMPWSFVIDWFLPVGNFIKSFTADTGLTFVRGTKTVTSQIDQRITRKWAQTEPNMAALVSYGTVGWLSGGIAVAAKKETTKTRTVLASPPTLRLPEFKNPISINHLIETAALLTQLKYKPPAKSSSKGLEGFKPLNKFGSF